MDGKSPSASWYSTVYVKVVFVSPDEGSTEPTKSTGAVFSAELIVILTESLPVAPSLSVAVRVMVCTPTDKSSLAKELPVPKGPYMLEVQSRE